MGKNQDYSSGNGGITQSTDGLRSLRISGASQGRRGRGGGGRFCLGHNGRGDEVSPLE